MSRITEQNILDALKAIKYPGDSENIVSSGMVQNDIKIEDNKVSFSIRFKKAKDPFYKSVIKTAESVLLSQVDGAMEIKGNITPLFPELPQEPAEDKILSLIHI